MRRVTLLAVVGVLALAGCGGDDEDTAESTPAPTATETADTGGAASDGGGGGGGGGGETLAIAADPGGGLEFDKTELEAKAGKVTIEMANPSDVPHSVTIDGGEDNTPGETVTKDGTSTASAQLEAGEYTYFCPVGGHRSAGMEGTLTVQ